MSMLQGEQTLPVDKKVEEVFNLKAAQISENDAIIFGNKRINYAELRETTDLIAGKLKNILVDFNSSPSADGDLLVAVCFEPSPELIAVLIAIWKVGGAYLPIDPGFPEGHIGHILSDANPALILTDQPKLPALASSAKDKNVPIVGLSDLASRSSTEVIPCKVQNTAVVLYTSGSTGMAKGVRLTHGNILSRLSWQWRVFPYDRDEICCFKTALTFVDSVAEIFAPLLHGIPVVIIRKKEVQNPDVLISILEKFKITRFILVPSLLRSILAVLKEDDRKLESLKMWICSGETLAEDLVLAFFGKFPEGKILANFYGSTEITGDVTYATMKNIDEAKRIVYERKIPIGRVVDNCRVYLTDENLTTVPVGEIGEICVAGAHVALGYVCGSASEKFVKNPDGIDCAYATLYRTGDFARIVQGQLIYEGRKDSQIKIRGHRVDLTQIEGAIAKLGEMKESVVLCYKPGDVSQAILAFCSPFNGITPEATTDLLRRSLPSYMLPKVIFVDAFPRLVNGKVDRQSLLRQYEEQMGCKNNNYNLTLEGFDVNNKKFAAAVALLKTISSVVNGWCNLGVDLSSNFFDIGGNSLNAILVVTKLQDQGYNMKISDFLCANSLQEIVDFMVEEECESTAKKCKRVIQSKPMGRTFRIEKMTLEHKKDVIDLISACFSTKGDLEILTGATYEDFSQLVTEMYDKVIAKELSFVVMSSDNVTVGASFNTDLYDPVPLKPPNKRVSDVFEVIDFVENPVRDSLPSRGIRGYYLHGQMMGTRLDLTPAENVSVIQIMEEEVLHMAKERGFRAVLTTNTSSLTQQMCDDVLGYRVMADYEVRNFIASDGSTPFSKANEAQRVQTTLKTL